MNGQVRQSGTTADMIFSVAYLVSLLSKTRPLLPGDVIFTGTPSGAGPYSPATLWRCASRGSAPCGTGS